MNGPLDDDEGDAGIRIVAEPVRYRIGPLIGLIAIALVPAIGLNMLARWSDAKADRYEASGGARLFEAELVGTFADDSGAPSAPTTDDPLAPGLVPELSTRLFDYRRAADQVAAATSIVRLGAAVDPVLGFAGDRSCAAVSVDGAIATTLNPDLAVIPASNQKLLVAFAALDVLGPDYTFTTSVAVPPAQDGVVDGDIYLIGGGDPLLTSTDFSLGDDRLPVTTPTPLDALADDLVEAGITRIRGTVIGDGTRYDDEFFIDEWADGIAVLEAGPYDALLANDARVQGRTGVQENPSQGAAREFVRLLNDRDIRVDNGWGSGVASTLVPVVATVQSAPLSDVIAEMLSTSDNNTAEMLVKEMGIATSGTGSRAAGLDAMLASLGSQGIAMDGVVLRDGSGLSTSNRVTCTALLQILQRSQGGPIDAGLAVAGRSGTLADEFVENVLAGRLRAKTGTLANPPVETDPPAVKALAGYVDPLEGSGAGTIEFVLIVNGPDATSVEVYRPLWNALSERFAAYPAGPPPESLLPR